MVEIFTIGGGDYLVNALNAVAAWTGDGGYKSLLQVVMVMGLAFATLSVAFNADWRSWVNWFLGATLIYSCLMVPRLDVKITDRIDPGLAPATVSGVPLGLALMASFTSQVGDYLVRASEVVFGLPGDLDYSKNGMIYGARLLDATKGLRISDPEFAANLDEHFRQCVFYDVLLGRTSMKTLADAPDIWAVIGPGSQARAQKFLTRDVGGGVTSTIVTCRDGYTALSTQWSGLVDGMGTAFGRQLYPKETAALAKAKLFSDLPIAYQYLTGVSSNAADIFKQVLTINAMGQAMHTMVGASGASNVDVYAQTRADIQTERTYGSIAQNAMKWVPLLNIVLTILFYALFPVLFPLFLMPKSGPAALKGYVTGFFYLAAWGPLFVILHMILMWKGAADVAAAGAGTGLTLATFNGVAEVNSDIGLLAGYLIASVPFLAGGVAKGALAISSQAVSYLNPSQNAAEEAAREASTGNVGIGNSNIETQNALTRQFAQGSTAPSFTYGAAQTRGFSDSGTMTTSFAEQSFDQVPNSSYPFTPTLGQEFTSRLSTLASQSRSQSDTYSNLAAQATSAAVTRFRELRNAFSSGSSNETATGTNTGNSIQTAYGEVDNASQTLQRQFGLSRRAADDITVSWFLNGEASAGVGGNIGIGSASASVKGGRNQSWTDSDVGIASEDRSRIVGSLRQLSTSRNWSSTRDGFVRSVSSSSSSAISSSASGLTNSLTESQSYTTEARRSQEVADRLEKQASWFAGNSASGALNLSQSYREWGMGELSANPDFYGNARFDDIDFQLGSKGQELQARFVKSYADRLYSDLDGKLALPTFAAVAHPQIGSPNDIRSHATVGNDQLSPRQSSAAEDADGIATEVAGHQQDGRSRIGVVGKHLKEVTRDAKGSSAEAADGVKEW